MAVEQADEADDVAAGASGVTSRDRLGGDLAAYRQGVGLSAALDDVGNIVHTDDVTKRLQAIGNSAGIIIDRPILDLLGITQETDLELKTDGKRLIITPLASKGSRREQLAKVQARALRRHADTFRKLAK